MKNPQRLRAVALVTLCVLASSQASARHRKLDLTQAEQPVAAATSAPDLANEARSFANIYLAIYGSIDKKVVTNAVDQLVSAQATAPCSPWFGTKSLLNSYRPVDGNRGLLLRADKANLQSALYNEAKGRQRNSPGCDPSKTNSLIVTMRIAAKTAAQGGGYRIYYIPQLFSLNTERWETVPPQTEIYTDSCNGRVGQTLIDKLNLDVKLLQLDCPAVDSVCLANVLKTATQRAEQFAAAAAASERRPPLPPQGSGGKPSGPDAKDQEIQALKNELAAAKQTKPQNCATCGPGPIVQPPTSHVEKHRPSFYVSVAMLGLGLGASTLATGILGHINQGDGGTFTLNPVCGPLQNMSCGAVRHSLGSGVYALGLSIPLWGIGLGAVLLAEFVPGKKASKPPANQGTPSRVSPVPPATAPNPVPPSLPPPTSAPVP